MIKTSPQQHEGSNHLGDRNDETVRDDGLKSRSEEIMCKIDVRNVDEKDDVQVCRICQLSSDQLSPSKQNVNLVVLGCNCRGDLGISHYHCAFNWFTKKGNRTCEICGKPAKNIEGIEDTGFPALGGEIDMITSVEIRRSFDANDSRRRCTKSLCNFILAALVVAFLLSWAVRPKLNTVRT